jgi:hypothetical protein
MNTYLKLSALLSATAVALVAQPGARERYQALTDEIFFRPKIGESLAHMNARAGAFHFPPDARMEQATVELHDLAQAAIQMALSSADASAESVQAALRDLQGSVALGSLYPDWSNVPFADVQSVNGFSTLAAAFAVVRGGLGIPQVLPSIQFYSHAGGVWKLAAETAGSEMSGNAFSLARIQSPQPDHEAWYLVWGRKIGSSRIGLRMEVLAFDGLNVRSVWTREGLEAGTASVVSGRVRLEYYENLSPGDGHHGPAKHFLEILRPGLNGLELVERSELPQ